MPTRMFTVHELDALDIGPWNCLANIEGEQHRWYTIRHLVFEHEGRHWMVDYMEPASEQQEGQDVWEAENEAVEVHQVPRVMRLWVPVSDEQRASDPAEQFVIDHLADWFHDLDDSEDAPFGPFAHTEIDQSRTSMTVSPDPDPSNWDDGTVPATPVVLIVAHRVK